MSDERARRLALNEAAFRMANERVNQWPERREQDTGAYYCECAVLECGERVTLALADYERVRADSRRFLVVPGHEIPDVERVIERADGYFVIEKNPEVTAIVERTNPRASG